VIEQMFQLKGIRAQVLRKIRYFRTKMRFPVPEAAYRGNWQIIERIWKRRMLHFNFTYSWMYPAPPPPYLRKIPKYHAKPPKLEMFEILTHGMSDVSAGQYIAGTGWVGPNDPREHFGEAHEQLTEIWRKVKQAQDEVKAECLKNERLGKEKIRQRDAIPDMLIAIQARDYRKCVYLATECGVSIDMETPPPKCVTALIGAAEEDTGVPFYAPMLNDDNNPCLAVAYLLDRTDFRPSINLEVSTGHTALIRACSLNRASVVEALLDRGAEVNYVNKFGKTPLHYAATVGSFTCCRILLERGADVHAKTPEGQTAFHIADEYGFLPIMTQLGRHATGFMGPVRPNRGRVDVSVRCPLGCGANLESSEVAFHERECANRVVKCPKDCGVRLLMYKEIDLHLETECDRRITLCKHCEAPEEERNQAKHFAQNCAHRSVDCVLSCGKQIKVLDMRKHIKFCVYRTVPCAMHCGQDVMVKDMLDHDRNYCEMRKVACTLDCGAMVSVKLTQHHAMNVCPNRIEACRFCRFEYKFRDLEYHEKAVCHIREEPCPSGCGEPVVIGEPTVEHLASFCAFRFVPCTLKCGQKIRFCDMAGHQANVCDGRLVPCPLGCKVDDSLPPLMQVVTTMRAKIVEVHTSFECPLRKLQCFNCKDYIRAHHMEEHKRTLCPMREVPCANLGCSKIINLGTRDEHERKTCKFRLLSCPQGCGMDIPWIQHSKHMGQACAMRRVECPLKCGATGLRHKQLEEHMQTECPRRHAQPSSTGIATHTGAGSAKAGKDLARPTSRGTMTATTSATAATTAVKKIGEKTTAAS
jgi:hypothetical protein